MLKMLNGLSIDKQPATHAVTRGPNTLSCALQCASCWVIGDVSVEMPIGDPTCETYRLGERVRWRENASFAQGGRPDDGHCVVEGCAQCSTCHSDLSVSLHVWQDRLTKAVALGLFRQTDCFS